MKEVYDELIAKIQDNNYTEEEQAAIEKALDFAREQHKGMRRKW